VSQGQLASELISRRIAELRDWRGIVPKKACVGLQLEIQLE
jgi:hypothetical protein